MGSARYLVFLFMEIVGCAVLCIAFSYIEYFIFQSKNYLELSYIGLWPLILCDMMIESMRNPDAEQLYEKNLFIF
jgi:hypothetical protein